MTQQHDAPEGGAAQPVAWRAWSESGQAWRLYHEDLGVDADLTRWEPLYPAPPAPSGLVDAVRERPNYLVREEAEMWDVKSPFPNAPEGRNASSTTSQRAFSTSTDVGTAETRNGSELVDLAKLIYSEIPKEKPKQIVVTSATGPHLGAAAFMVAVPWDRLTSMEQQPYLAAAGRVMADRQAFVDAMIAVASSDSRVWQERSRNEKVRADRLEAALADQQGVAETPPQSAASGEGLTADSATS